MSGTEDLIPPYEELEAVGVSGKGIGFWGQTDLFSNAIAST